jgi:tetratricopeptide (TPR) repeat protein
MKSISFYTGVILCAALLWTTPPAVHAANAATEQLLSKARSLEGRGRLDLAARVWEQTLLADPNNAEALVGLAKFAKQNGKIEEANRYLERLRNLDPNNPAIGTVLGMTTAGKQRAGIEEANRLAASQNFEGAMRIYRSLFGNEPPPGAVAISYYETEASTPGGWKDGVAAIEQLAKKYPLSEEYKVSLGRLKTYREASRLEGMQILSTIKGESQLVGKARAAWRQALIWAAGSPESLPLLESYLARYPDPEVQKLMVHGGKTNEVAALHGPLPMDNTESTLAYNFLNAQKVDEAEKHFQIALRTTPHNPVPLAGMGYVRMKQEDFHAAAELFQQALETQPKNQSLLEALATSRFWEQMKIGGDAAAQNKPDVAVPHFEKALSLRPASEQAIESLAGAHMMRQQPALAMPLYEKLTRLKQQSLESWYGLVKAKSQLGNFEDALAVLKQAPPQVKEDWGKNPEHLAMLSFIYADAGATDESQRVFERAIATARANRSEVPVYQQMEFAGRSLRLGHAKQAADMFLQIAAKHPANVDAWTGSMNALLQVSDAPRAYQALQRIPQNTYALALTKPEFLRSVARLQSAMKRYDLAEKALIEAARLENAQGKQADFDAQLQMANLGTHIGKSEDSEKLLRSLTEEYPNDKRAWISLVALLHEQKSDPAALAEIERMPEKASVEAEAEPGFVILEAGVYMGAGHKERALSIVRSAQKHFEALGRAVPVNLEIQLAWLLMANQDSQNEVTKILDRDNLRSDMTGTERRDLNQISSVWAQRRAQAAIEAKEMPKAISILQAAAVLLPADPRLEAMLASAFLRAEDFPRAFEVYQRWDLKNAEADDFRGAVGAASANSEKAIAANWLDRGLKEFPSNPRLLQLAGEQAAQHRDYERASYYLRRALEKISSDEPIRQEQKVGSVKSAPSETSKPAEGILGSFLSVPAATTAFTDDVLQNDLSPSSKPNAPFSALRVNAASPYYGGARAVLVSAPVGSSSDSLTDDSSLLNRSFAEGKEAGDEITEPDFIQPVELVGPTPKTAEQLALREEIQSELAAIEGRNTPYFQNGVNIQQRSGEGGFDKLLIEEAHLETSTTVGDRFRLTLIAKPTYVDSGAPATPGNDGHLGFGATALDATPGLRSAFGIGVEAQLSTTNFGLRFGLSPEEFLVHGWIGGLRWNPAGGPFTILVDRDSVRDTKLSFAGERDPSSQLVWGGVMANSASLIGNWSHGNTGYYAKAGYQDIEGQNVAKNSRIEVNAGSYFKIYRSKAGELTVGLNMTGMHYDKNLRYFTLGQGGYFSPQQYFLFNVPAHWTGKVNQKLQYSISASLGVQHFTENASPYFPTDAGRQALLGLSYPTYTNTSGNYNLSVRTIYQITPQWLGGAFFDVNNSREYRSVNAGLYLKYLIRPRPASSTLSLTPVPDWTGASPFDVP